MGNGCEEAVNREQPRHNHEQNVLSERAYRMLRNPWLQMFGPIGKLTRAHSEEYVFIDDVEIHEMTDSVINMQQYGNKWKCSCRSEGPRTKA